MKATVRQLYSEVTQPPSEEEIRVESVVNALELMLNLRKRAGCGDDFPELFDAAQAAIDRYREFAPKPASRYPDACYRDVALAMYSGRFPFIIDRPAVVHSQERTNGAYVNAWLWIPNAAVADRYPPAIIELFTPDNANGIGFYYLVDGEVVESGFAWSHEAADQVRQARICSPNGVEVAIDGAAWRWLVGAEKVLELAGIALRGGLTPNRMRQFLPNESWVVSP